MPKLQLIRLQLHQLTIKSSQQKRALEIFLQTEKALIILLDHKTKAARKHLQI
jgi:hypothetical protein